MNTSALLLLIPSYNTPYEKIGNNEPISIADEVPFEIPDTWEWVTLKMVAISELGKTLDKAKNKGTLRPYLCSINVYWNGISLDTVKQARFEDDELPKYCLQQGDLLICEGGDVGRSAVWTDTQEMYYQNALHRVRFYGGISPFYFQMLLECYKGNKILDAHSKGMTIKHLVQSSLNSIYFPLPPVNEQHRIVNVVRKILPYLQKYNSVESELTALNSTFPTQLRNSILQMAVQGKLVLQDPADEPASVLLERIREEKWRLVAEGKIKRDKHESVIFRRDNSHYEKCGSVETCIDDIIPFEVPGNWIWVRLGTLIEEKPSNGYSPKGVPYSTNVKNLTLSATTSGYFKSDAYKYVDIEIPSDSKYWLKHNDILIQRSNSRELVGTACIYTGKDNEFIYPDLMMRIRAMNRIDIRYLDLVLKAPFSRRYFTSSASGTSDSMPKINQTIVTNTFVPLPPIEEQRRIMAFVDKLFSCLTF